MRNIKGESFGVLDHGHVKVIDHMGTDETIIRAARQSTDGEFHDWGTDEKLLEYLYANRHSTPFEMCELVVEVQAPIFVFRQWHRHRTFSYNEMSGRYTQLPDLFYVPESDRLRQRKSKNRQESSVDSVIDRTVEDQSIEEMLQDIGTEQDHARRAYQRRISRGVPKETARVNVPVSQYSKMWAKGNLRNWFHFLSLRMDSHAQAEIRQYADTIANNIISVLWPRSYALFLSYDLGSISFSADEFKSLQRLLRAMASPLVATPESPTDAEVDDFLRKYVTTAFHNTNMNALKTNDPKRAERSVQRFLDKLLGES